MTSSPKPQFFCSQQSSGRKNNSHQHFSNNPFVKQDKASSSSSNNLFGKSLFRPRFTRFGTASKGQWQRASTHPADILQQLEEERRLQQREEVRNELSQALQSARNSIIGGNLSTSSTATNIHPASTATDSFLSPRQVLERHQQQLLTNNLKNSPVPNSAMMQMKAWPSSPCISGDQQQNYSNWQTGITRRNSNNSSSSSSNNITMSSNNKRSAFSSASCHRCCQPVYPLEKVEPVAGQIYHPQCFRCGECQIKLSLATYCRSLQSTKDSQVYCRAHQPKQDKVILCRFSTRKSEFPAFKLSWQSPSTQEQQLQARKT